MKLIEEKTKWIAIRLRPKKFPFTCKRILFEMVEDGDEKHAVKMLLAYMEVGDMFFNKPKGIKIFKQKEEKK